MEKVGVRDLRNRVSEVVRRARQGHRITITSNGIPVAEIGPITEPATDTIEALAEAGLVLLPRSQDRRPAPVAVAARSTSEEVLESLRSR